MATPVPSSTPNSAAPKMVVWDRFVRLFHWGLVALVAIAFLSRDFKAFHIAVGYGVLALIVARLVWGLFGTTHARFTDFVVGPRAIAAYLRSLRSGAPAHHVGHNPAGGAMVLALLAVLLAIVGSGWMSETDRFFGVEWVSVMHSLLTSLLLGLIGLHLLGVLVASILHRENLVRAMITGRKPNRPD